MGVVARPANPAIGKNIVNRAAGVTRNTGAVRADFVTPQRNRDRAPYYRVLITGQPVPPEFTDALVDQYLAHAARSTALPGYC
jgi:hypothetical protein